MEKIDRENIEREWLQELDEWFNKVRQSALYQKLKKGEYHEPPRESEKIIKNH